MGQKSSRLIIEKEAVHLDKSLWPAEHCHGSLGGAFVDCVESLDRVHNSGKVRVLLLNTLSLDLSNGEDQPGRNLVFMIIV